MKYYGTKNNRDYGFYEEKFDGAVEITDEYWFELLNRQTKGAKIILYENNVIAVDKKEYVSLEEFEKGISTVRMRPRGFVKMEFRP